MAFPKKLGRKGIETIIIGAKNLMFSYVQLSDAISVYQEDYGLKLIHKSTHPRLFNLLINDLHNKDSVIENLMVVNIMDPKDLLKVSTGYLYKGQEVSSNLIELAHELQDSGYSLTPIINFLDKCLDIKDNSLRLDLHDLVASRKVPITFDGNVIFYKRSSWHHQEGMVQKDNKWHVSCVGGDVVIGEELQLGLLEWTVNGCLDQGPISEVMVQPVNVQSVTEATAERAAITVSKYTYLGVLETGYEESTRIVIIYDKVNSLGDSVLVRLPYDSSSVTTYLSEVARNSLPISEPSGVRFQNVLASC